MTPRAAGALLAVVSLAGPLGAQTRPAPAADTSGVPLAFAVPEAPAFTFLGISPAKVTRASTPRDIGAALVNGIDSSGRVRTGVAVGATLWTLVPGVTIPPARYRHNRAAYALANTSLSFGTARASGDSADTDLALGVRTTIVDASDPMADSAFVSALTAALRRCADTLAPPPMPPGTAGSTTTADPCAGAANDTVRQRWFHNHWNKPALSWGAGLGWRLPRSELRSPDPLGVSTWLAGAYPLGAGAQLLGQLQYDHRTARDSVTATDLLTYGARAATGSKDYNLFVEVAGTRRLKAGPTVSRSNVQWSGGAEFQAGPNYWLSTGFGRRYAAAGKPDRVVVFANLRFGIASKSRLRLLATPGRGA